MKIEYNITQNKFNTSLNQEVTEIKLQFQTGYYPIPVGLSNYYNKNEVDNLLDLKADVLLLDNYYTKNETYNQDELNGFLNLKADLSLLNNYYTETEINNKLQLKQNLPTGYVTGLQLSIHPTDNTKAIIGIGAYIITDFSDLENITATLVQVTEPIEFAPAYLTTSPSSYIALDINKNVIQSAIPFDNADRRTLCLVGNVVHSNLTNINVVNEIKSPIIAPTNQLHDLIKAVGFLNLEGNLISPNGSNLSLNKSAGKIWGLGINGGDYLDPHVLTLPEQTAITFRYRLSVSPLVEYANRVTLDPTQFEPNGGGVLSPLSNNNRWSVQHLNIFQSGVVRVQYGQHEYDSFVKARNAAFTEQFVTEQNIADNAIFRCYIIMKKTCTNLQLDITNGEAEIIHIGKFGNAVGGSNASLTLSNILAVLGYTPENVANKSDSYTASSSTTYASTKALVDGLATKLSKGTYTGTASDLVPYNGATQNVNIGAYYFESSQGFKKTSGTSNQALTADGNVFDLTTKADLIGGKVPSSQLPAYVDDVLEFANLSNFPATGESGKIYIAIDTNVTYRWTGTGYAEISASLALGETSSTAYRGDRGKIAFDHSQTTGNPHGTTKADIGLGNVDNTSDLDKPISTATQNALNSKQDKLETVSGNIGVGKTDASATEKLDVNGNIKATSFIKSGGISTQYLMADGSVSTLTNPITGTGTTNYLPKFLSSGTVGNSIIYDNGSSVGIGTTNPSSILHLNSAVPFLSIQGSTTGSLRGINIMQGTTVFSSLSAEASLGETRLSAGFSGWGGFQTFHTNGSEKMRITSSGNVGIGTSSPGYKLDVSGIINVSDTPNSYGTLIRLRDTVSLGTESFGGVLFTSSPGTDYTIGKWSTAAGAGLLQIRDQSGNAFMTINGVGNVGIGTTSPSEKLEVNGNIKATSFFESSLRKYKTNIKKFDKSGIDLVDSLEIVTFDRIDSDVKSKIGIIADDTSDEFLSNDKCAVDLYKTVFIQAKAIQELKSEVDELKEELNNLRDLIMLNLNKV